jgi:hypothetical protein
MHFRYKDVDAFLNAFVPSLRQNGIVKRCLQQLFSKIMEQWDKMVHLLLADLFGSTF